MLLWEYVIHGDREHDLTRTAGAREWLASFPWGPLGEWPLPANWEKNVLALCSLARRIGGRRLHRKPPPRGRNDFYADGIATEYLGKMRRCILQKQVQIGPDAMSEQPPLSKTSFKIIELPTVYLPPGPHSRPLNEKGEPLTDRLPVDWTADPGWWVSSLTRGVYLWPNDADIFWQLVFDSLLTGSGPAVCQLCGEVLGAFTPQGRRKRQLTCKPCQRRKWFSNQSMKRKRTIYRRDWRLRQSRKNKSNVNEGV